MRIKALIAYDGTAYYGWQIQPIEPTIQSSLQKCVRHISGQEISVTGAGRTDSGVHAYEQVAHFDWEHPLSPEKLLLGMNAILPVDIRVRALEPVENKFHARFDAKSKSYIYRIDRSRFRAPFEIRYALHYSYPLDASLLQECARTIEGEHDFLAFQAAGTDVISTVRTVQKVDVFSLDQPAGPFLYIRIQANGFLRKMVRFLVGTFLEIAKGKRDSADLSRALETKDRKYVGVPAPARGLFLEKVYY